MADIKRPKSVIYFKDVPTAEAKDPPVDYYGFLAMMLGMGGFLTRVAWISWLSFMFFISSVVSVKSAQRDLSQLFTTFTLVAIGLVANYVALFKAHPQVQP